VLRQILRELRDAGCCIVFSSHVLQEVSDLCDHLVILSDGRVSAEGSPEEIYRESGCGSLEEAFMKLTTRESLPC
jgi:sodium transport system ATP-binding protein